MVNIRLQWYVYIATKERLSPFHYGHSRGRSTIDALVFQETYIRNAFTKLKSVTYAFFDLEENIRHNHRK